MLNDFPRTGFTFHFTSIKSDTDSKYTIPLYIHQFRYRLKIHDAFTEYIEQGLFHNSIRLILHHFLTYIWQIHVNNNKKQQKFKGERKKTSTTALIVFQSSTSVLLLTVSAILIQQFLKHQSICIYIYYNWF